MEFLAGLIIGALTKDLLIKVYRYVYKEIEDKLKDK
jgi:hypothetical protein